MAFQLMNEAYYTEEQLRIFGLDGEALTEARDSRKLRYKEVGGTIWYKGEWVMAWLDRQEVASES